MDLLVAVARWRVCDYGKDKCLGQDKCPNYIWVDPRTGNRKNTGPGTTGKRTLCALFDDLKDQIAGKEE
jgi:hypothetical protein